MRTDKNNSTNLAVNIRSLLTKVSALDPSGAAELGALRRLRLDLAEPLQQMIEQAFVWLDTLQTITIDRVAAVSRMPGRDWELTSWTALRDLCLAAKRELRFAVADLTEDDHCWPDAVDRCERINARVVEALRLVIDAIEAVSRERDEMVANGTGEPALRPTVEYPSDIISALCADSINNTSASHEPIAAAQPPKPRRTARGSQIKMNRTATLRDIKPFLD